MLRPTLPQPRPWNLWSPGLQRGLLVLVFVMAVAALWGQRNWQTRALKGTKASLSQLLQQLQGTETSKTTAAEDLTHDTASPPLLPELWPPQDRGVDEWVRAAAQDAADASGISLQQLSISYPAAESITQGTLTPKPFALLQVSARGSYGRIKAWQANLQQQMPSLSIERQRWQTPPNDGTGQMMAEWTWRLWLRPAHVEAPREGAPSITSTASLRPLLSESAKDPFGMTAPPPPPPPVVTHVPPPVVYAPPPPPPLNWVAIGRLQGTDGKQRVTGHWGDSNAILTLTEGDESPRGHKVTKITSRSMEMIHPQTQDRLEFSLPVAPQFERR